MKKIFASIIVLYIFFFFLEFCFNYFKKSHEVTYVINNIEIKEDYKGNTKGETNNYYFEIKTPQNTFHIQTYEDFKKENKIIKEIKYFTNEEYECILPIFKKDQILTDLICINNKGIEQNYNTIQNDEIDNFLSEIKLYKKENYIDDTKNIMLNGTTTYYANNLNPNYFLAFTYYKGVKIADQTSLREVELFKKDRYTQKVKTFAYNKYITIDYNNNYESNEFIVLDLKNRKTSTIGSNFVVNFDSYIQGIVNNSVYVFDKDTKSQYQIDLKEKTIIRTGTASTGIKYYDGTWQNKSAYDAAKEEIIFKEYDSSDKYIMIKKIMGNNYGTTIYVEEENGIYKVYKSPRNNGRLIYLFTTTDYKTMYFLNDYIYYKDGIYIKQYSDLTGSKTIIKDSEITNKTVSFYIGENV